MLGVQAWLSTRSEREPNVEAKTTWRWGTALLAGFGAPTVAPMTTKALGLDAAACLQRPGDLSESVRARAFYVRRALVLLRTHHFGRDFRRPILKARGCCNVRRNKKLIYRAQASAPILP
jgi:hypothetical protein